MYEEIIKFAMQYGLFPVLFVFLFFYDQRQQKAREVNYQKAIKENQKIIGSLAEKLGVVDEIKNDVEDIKEEIWKKGRI